MVQKQVLGKIDGDQLRVFVVWLPMLPADSRAAAAEATKLIGDKRARHYWDGDKKLSTAIAKVLELPRSHRAAWDVYLVFPGSADWAERIPRPSEWMHQLEAVAASTKLDGDKLRESVLKLLKGTPANK